MTVALADELLVPEPDIASLARRWAQSATEDTPLDSHALAGFAHLRDTGVPRPAGVRTERPTLPRHLLPVALLAFDNPRTLVGLTWHLAALTHPEPDSTWAAVAINVAAARLLQGHRDFVPDVIEALRNNDAPSLLLETVRRLPLLRRENIEALQGSTSPAVSAACSALWILHSEARPGAALVWLIGAPDDSGSLAPVAAGLVGARDGVEALPDAWKSRASDWPAIERLAARLARVG